MNDAADYAVALAETRHEMTDTDLAEQVAYVFLTPLQAFLLWLKLVKHHYLS